MVEGWRPSRQGVLGGLQALAQQATPQQDGHGDRKVKRRKTSHGAERVSEIFSGMSTRSRTKKALASSQDDSEHESRQPIEIIEDTEDDGSEYGLESSNLARNSPPLDDGLVPCPMCNRRMKEEAVFTHLDRCNGTLRTTPSPPPVRPGPHKSRSNLPSGRTGGKDLAPISQERLPTINYSLFKDQALRNKLKDLGIPNWGSKQLLQRRHREWLNIWNANCDSRNPRSKKELLGELDTWERTQGGHAPTNGGPSNMMFTTGVGASAHVPANSVGEKDFDKDSWSKTHGNDFKELIRRAQMKRSAATTAAAPTSPASDRGEQQQSNATDGIPPENRENAVTVSSTSNGLQETIPDVMPLTSEPNDFLEATGRQHAPFHPASTPVEQASQIVYSDHQVKGRQEIQSQNQDPQISNPSSSQQGSNPRPGRVFV